MFESLSEKLSDILENYSGGCPLRGRRQRRDARSASRLARSRCRARGRALVCRPDPHQGGRRGRHQVGQARSDGRQDRPRFAGRDAGQRESQAIDLNAPAPVAIMLVGLQGAGKTTTAAKIAKRLTERDKHKVLMASLDVAEGGAGTARGARPTGRRRDLADRFGEDPVAIAKRAESAARLQGRRRRDSSTPPGEPTSTSR